MKKGMVYLISIITITVFMIISMVALQLIQIFSKEDEIAISKETETNIAFIDFENSALELYCEFHSCNIYINNIIQQAEIVEISNGIRCSLKERFPTNEKFDIFIEILNSANEVVDSIYLYSIYEHTGITLEETSIPEDVVYLSISNSEIIGDIHSLINLKKIKYINFNKCKKLAGNLSDLKGMDLEYLRIAYCDNIIGKLDSLSNMNNLKYLSLYSYYNVTGNIEDIQRLGELRHLDIFGLQNVEGDIKALLNLPKIEYLRLYATRLTGNMGTISSLKNLKYLELSTNKYLWGNISQLSDLTLIKELNVSYSRRIYGNVASLNSLGSLDRLQIKFCPLVGGTIQLKNGDIIKVRYFDKANPMNIEDYQ